MLDLRPILLHSFDAPAINVLQEDKVGKALKILSQQIWLNGAGDRLTLRVGTQTNPSSVARSAACVRFATPNLAMTLVT